MDEEQGWEKVGGWGERNERKRVRKKEREKENRRAV